MSVFSEKLRGWVIVETVHSGRDNECVRGVGLIDFGNITTPETMKLEYQAALDRAVEDASNQLTDILNDITDQQIGTAVGA